jgi:hypothetical protein
MRPSLLGKLDRNAIYYREPPARRRANLVSILFLLSLSGFAAVTSVQTRAGEQDDSRISIADLQAGATR